MKIPSSYILHLLLGSLLLSVGSVMGQSRSDYDFAYIGDPLPDPLMQQNKETFVLYGCAYCHGINLKPVGEATDLRTSPLVAADVDANVIGPILRTGIPQTPKSSPMPQFSDLSDREIRAITSYIHYARGQENYKVLMNAPASDGDADSGKTYFDRSCSSCHSADRDLSGIGSRYDTHTLREQVLEPTRYRIPATFNLDERNNTEMNAGRARHQILLENYAEADVTNVVAYLQTLK